MRLEDQTGFDLLNGVGAARSISASQQVAIVYGTGQLPASIVGAVHPCVHEGDTLTFIVDNHLTPSAQMTVAVYYAMGA